MFTIFDDNVSNTEWRGNLLYNTVIKEKSFNLLPISLLISPVILLYCSLRRSKWGKPRKKVYEKKVCAAHPSCFACWCVAQTEETCKTVLPEEDQSDFVITECNRATRKKRGEKNLAPITVTSAIVVRHTGLFSHGTNFFHCLPSLLFNFHFMLFDQWPGY